MIRVGWAPSRVPCPFFLSIAEAHSFSESCITIYHVLRVSVSKASFFFKICVVCVCV